MCAVPHTHNSFGDSSGVETRSTLRGRDEARAKGRNSKHEGLSQGTRVLERGLAPLPTKQLGGLPERCGLHQVGPGAKPRPTRILVHFGFLIGELSCSPAMQNCLCRPPTYAYNLMHLHASHNSFKKIYPVENTIMKFKLRILNI